MYPKELYLDDFVDHTALFRTFIPYARLKQIKDNIYAYYGSFNLEDIIGEVFVYESSAYKIISLEKKTYWQPVGYGKQKNVQYTEVILEEYSDAKVKKILYQLKSIKENLSVCADALEELGSLSVATELRTRMAKIKIKDLV
jgi:hypothetical protein